MYHMKVEPSNLTYSECLGKFKQSHTCHVRLRPPTQTKAGQSGLNAKLDYFFIFPQHR